MKIFLSALSLALCLTGIAHAQRSQVFVAKGTAIGGYDAVAYFTENKPVKGDKKYTYKWDGADWIFSSRQHLDNFKANPEKFKPQFGGYCAYGMAEGHKAPTQPDAWTIVNGKLYLNYNKDVQKTWLLKKDTFILTAEKNWQALKDKE